MTTIKRCFFAILCTLIVVFIAALAIMFLLRFFALEGLLVFGICNVAAFWGWVIRWLYIVKRLTFSHILVIWLVASGTVMSGASYYLAYREIVATLETLSRYVMVETVAGSAGYFLKAGIENSITKMQQKACNVTKDL